MATFGDRLRELRRAASLSQEELAERSGLTAAAVGALERGERRHPYPHTVAALGDALGLSDAERRELVALVPPRGRAAAPSPGERGLGPTPPSPMAPIVGRRRELDRLRTLLCRPEVRLVTLTGPGGVGKTRAAMEIARELEDQFPDGVAWFELAAIVEAGAVPSAIARGFGLAEEPATPPETTLAHHLRRHRLLLVLDGFEHLLDATPVIVGLLQACPGLTVLVTSREALHVSGEHEVQLAPLGLPAAAASGVRAVGSADAVRLLVQRAQAVAADFRLTPANAAAVAEVCVRVDGLPLALELAAPYLKHFSPAELSRRLASGIALESGARAIPPRQRSLQGTLDWSHDLLDGRERVLFRRLAVFRGGFSAESAAAVCAHGELHESVVPGVLAALVDKSLVVSRGGGDGRFAMLEVVHRYAMARLAESADERLTRARHALHMAELAESAEETLRGRTGKEAMRRLDLDEGNFRVALEWSLASPESRCEGARIAGALGWYWLMRGAVPEARYWTRALLAEPSACRNEHLAALLYTAAACSWKDGDLARAAAYVDEAVTRARDGGDQRHLAFAVGLQGLIAVSAGRGSEAVALQRESLACFRSLGHAWGEAYALANLGDALFDTGDLDAAKDCYNRALATFVREQDLWGQAIVVHTLGNIALREGEFRLAADLYQASIGLDRRMGNRTELARSLVAFGGALLHLGEVEAAAAAIEESLSTWDDYENADGRALCLTGLAAVARLRGELDASQRLLAEAREAVSDRPAVYVVDPGIFEPFLAGETANG
ncbi:MAG: helix-turn-helix domain-containing protein [Dehalococcoidia bacterium]|nr:helix-turn-helix domain-containing protein [Dehalococcoidia bacterium]